MKVCPACGELFTTRTRVHKYCSVRCGKRFQTRARLGLAFVPLDRACWWCHKTFRATDGRRDYCSPKCVRIGKSLWSMGARYGITRDEYRDRWLAQDGRCAVCRQPERSSRQSLLCVDHDHQTGKVRGLLCSHCNRAIGRLGDDPDVIQRAVQYVDPTYFGRKFTEGLIAHRKGITIERKAS